MLPDQIALSAELIFRTSYTERDWTIIPDTRESRQQRTARAVATKQGVSRKMKHIHTRFFLIQDLVFRKL